MAEEIESITRTGIERRTVLKGAAWSLPIIAAAVATPLAAASTVPACPACFEPGVLGGLTSQAIILGNIGALAFAGAFGIDSTLCDLTLFQPVYTSIVTSATLTMSDGSTHTGTGLGTGTGTFGQIGALPGTWLFNNISFPNGTYALNSNPVRPVRMSVNVTLVLLGIFPVVEVECPVTLEWDLNVWGAGVVIFGAGTVNFTGTATGV